MKVSKISLPIKKIATSAGKKINSCLMGSNVVDAFDLPASTLKMYASTPHPMKILNFDKAMGQIKCRQLLGLDNELKKSAEHSALIFYKAMPIESLQKTSFVSKILNYLNR